MSSVLRPILLLLLAWVTATGQETPATPQAPATPPEPAAPEASGPTTPAVEPPAVPATPPASDPTTARPVTPVKPDGSGGPTIRPTTPGGGIPIPGTTPGSKIPPRKPIANAAGPQPGIPLGENKIVEDIVEPKLSGNALAGLYRKFTGRRVIVSTAASTAEFAFVQDASPENPLTYAKAAELLKKAATVENFVFVPDADDPNLDILTLATGGLRPTGRGVAVYNENEELPEGDAVISYVMTLQYIKPAEAVNTFTQIIGQFGAFGSIAPVANASAVVITENTSLIRKLIDLKAEIDKPSSQVATRFIKVQFADVTELATTLTELLTAQTTAQKTAGIQRAEGAPPAPPPAPGAPPAANVATAAAGGSSSGEETPVQIIPEPRTNRIFAMGRPVDLLFVEGLVKEFDVQTSDKTFLRRKLRFLAVADFLPVASDALTRAFSAGGEGATASAASRTGGGGAAGSAGANQGGRSQSNNRQSTSATNRSRTSSSNTSGMSSGFGSNGSSFGGSSGGTGSALDAPAVNSAPESVLVGRTLLVADNITNTIVAQGPPSGLEIIERLLDQIDVKPDQVMISTVIGLLTLGDSHEFGASYLFRGGDFQGGGGGGIPIVPITGTAADRFPNFDPSGLAASGLRMYGTAGDLSVFVKALQTKTDFTVLSRPSIFTSNNQKGTISSGERIAIPTEGGTTSGAYSSGTRIQYQDVVLKLEVIPLVNSKEEITMQIALLNDEQNGEQVIEGAGTNGGDLTVPRISTREILTTATVPNNQTIVLGGLIVGKKNQSRSGIPILSDIPLVGRLFSTTTNNDDRSELMVFIQPSIVNRAQTLNDVQVDMDARYQVSPDARKFADGPAVLPPVNEIPRVEEKGRTASPQPATAPQPATSTRKKSWNVPPHRR